MRLASVEQADSLSHGDIALHVLATLGTFVQLLPVAFRRFVVAHSRISFGSRRASVNTGSSFPSRKPGQGPDKSFVSVLFHRPSVATAAISEPASTGFVKCS